MTSAATTFVRLRRYVGTLLSVMLLGSVVAGAAALIVVPKLTGSTPLTVLTGSMSPTYAPGSVVIVRPTSVGDLQIGDPITYQIRSDDPELITHRIVSVAFKGDGRRQFVTRGDANGANDPTPVKDGQIRGRVWYSVPYVGHASTALSEEHRTLAINVLAGGLLLYGGYHLTSGLMERRRRRIEVTS
jgi:signal peptidase I